MKLCLVTGEFPPLQGGVGDYTRELGKALASEGVEVHIITSGLEEASEHKRAAPYSMHSVVERWSWNSWSEISRVVHQVLPEVLHIQYQAAAYELHPAINLLPLRMRLHGGGRPRVAVTFHDLRVPYLFPKAGPLRRWSVLALARLSDAVVVTNERDEALLEPHGLQPYIIPIGSNIRPSLPLGFERTAWRSRWGVGSRDVLLCHFGFVNETKGIEVLLHALSDLVRGELSARRPQLLMIGGRVGSSDPTNVAYLRRVEAMIDDLGLEQRVHWTGFVSEEEVSASFAAADCCVLPYRDGVSLRHGTLMAALAHGMPIVSTMPADGGGQAMPAELTDGRSMVLVPPNDAPALGKAIHRLAQSPDLLRALGEGAEKLSTLFEWESIAARHLGVYRAMD